MADTKIEWTDKVWNPTTGCTKGCFYCYARTMAGRLQKMGQEKYRDGFTPACHPHELEKPLRWKKPCRIFVNSMGDLFDPAIPDHFIYQVLSVIDQTPQHTFQVLTKYPLRMRDLINNHWQYSVPRTLNLWLGVSVTNQADANERIPLLLKTTAAIRFVSIEPMLGPVDLHNLAGPAACFYQVLRPITGSGDGNRPALDWVVCGGMTGANAIPLHPDWVRLLRDQCRGADVPFFFKGWGTGVSPFLGEWCFSMAAGHTGKKASGSELDGREWKQFPEGK